jgi:hypothetical protein
MIIRPLTIEDLRQWWGDVELQRTVRGFAVLDGDEVKGVAGLMYLHSSIVAFAEMGEDGQKHPLTIMRVARAMKALMRGIVAPIFAVADEQYPNSAGFLKHCGFEQVVGRQYVFKNGRG